MYPSAFIPARLPLHVFPLPVSFVAACMAGLLACESQGATTPEQPASVAEPESPAQTEGPETGREGGDAELDEAERLGAGVQAI
jgi:hypothetical protein